MTEPLITPAYADALKRMMERIEAPLGAASRQEKKKLLRRSGLATREYPEAGVAAIRLLGTIAIAEVLRGR